MLVMQLRPMSVAVQGESSPPGVRSPPVEPSRRVQAYHDLGNEGVLLLYQKLAMRSTMRYPYRESLL